MSQHNNSFQFNWNPWHGCHKISPGCLNCYVYRSDDRHGKDASKVIRTKDFDLPLKKKRDGNWKIPSGANVWTCFTSDFLLDTADPWREEAWNMIRARQDLHFTFITKRIDRFEKCRPSDWENAFSHVDIYCTCENQNRADYRLPLYLSAPLSRRTICCEPLLEPINLSPYLRQKDCDGKPLIDLVVAGGESGSKARECRYEWILDLRRQCIDEGVSFWFKQTGANFVKDGRRYNIPRKLQHAQAKKAAIGYSPLYSLNVHPPNPMLTRRPAEKASQSDILQPGLFD